MRTQGRDLPQRTARAGQRVLTISNSLAPLMPVLTEASYRPHNRQCTGEAKNSDEPQVAASQRKAETKTREQGQRDQLPQVRRHIPMHPIRIARNGAPRPALPGTRQDLPQHAG
jgi:hypothetical protein